MMRSATVWVGLVVTVCVVSRYSGAEDRSASKPAVPAITFSLLDLKGATHRLDQNDGRRVRAYVFLSTHCPVSNGYIQTLNALHARFPEKPVDLFGVVSDASVTRSDAVEHFREFKAEFPILFDSSGLLQQALKPTHVPEAIVLDRNGQLVYRGAIDNAWEALGRRRPKAEKEFVADTIAAALDSQLPAIAETKPVGCLIESFEPGVGSAKVAATATWRTVMITSGEQPMTSFSEDGGTRARILEVWNSPFGCTSAEMAAFVTRLREEFNQNYGHAGPRFVA